MEVLVAKLVSSLNSFVVVFYKTDLRIYTIIGKNSTITKYAYLINLTKRLKEKDKKGKNKTYETNLQTDFSFIKSSLQLELHVFN